MQRSKNMKIAVVGTGANGAGIAADLVRAGRDVTLFDQWPANVEQMRASGLRVEFSDEVQVTPVRTLHFCQLAELRERFDAVLLLVKAYDTRWACELVTPYLNDNGFIVGVQNGMTGEDIVQIAGAERALGAVIEITAAMDQPGVVQRHSGHDRSWFAVGALRPEASGHVDAAAQLLRHAGAVEVTDDIVSAKWMKLALNAAELVPSAILDLSIAECARYREMREVMLAAGNEAVLAAQLTGLTVRPIFGMTGAEAAAPETFVATILDALIDGYILPHSRSTVLQDWSKGRRAEIEELHGTVIAALEAHGRPAPVNRAVLELARQIESGERERGTQLYPLLQNRIAELRERVPAS